MYLEKIMKMSIVSKRIEKFFPCSEIISEGENTLLNTIRIPKNLLYLTDKLPKPQYNEDEDFKEDVKENTAKFSITNGADYPSENKLPAISPKKLPKLKKFNLPRPNDKETNIDQSSKKEKKKLLSKIKVNIMDNNVKEIIENKKQYLENLLKNNQEFKEKLAAKLSTNNKVQQIISLHKKYISYCYFLNRKIDKLLDINREIKKKAKLALVSQKDNSINYSPYLVQNNESPTKDQLPSPFKIKSLVAKPNVLAIRKGPRKLPGQLNNILGLYSPGNKELKKHHED